MAGKILIISQNAEFTMNSISENLKDAGFDAVLSPPDSEFIDKMRADISAVVIYAGNFIETNPGILMYVRDILCTGDKRPLCIIGLDKQIYEIEKLIPPELISFRIFRPFDMHSLVSTVNTMIHMSAAKKSDKHLLLVDDDPMFLKMLSERLSQKYKVTGVKSGTQAIAYVAHHKPDLILLDYDMPVTSGPQVMQMIRSEPASQDIPIIFLTGNSDKSCVMSVMSLKPQGYLLKSMSREQMTDRIDEFFASQDQI